MTPKTEAELADTIMAANGPLRITGGGTRGIACEGAALSTSGLNGITLYEPGALTVVAQAGTPVSVINEALASENQRLAFEPSDLRDVLGTSGESTIGGVMATNASGPRRISAGACRDFALGVRFVDGAGQIVKNGGRVMKNVTGYDLVKLMAGSHGTLGILTEVSLKVLPDVEMQASLRLDGLDATQSVAAMSAALGSPYEVSGAARDLDSAVWLRLEGFESSVRYRADALMQKLGLAATLVEDSAEHWRDIRDARGFAGGTGDLWRISVKPTDAPAVLEELQPSRAMLDWGGGLIWAEMPEGQDLRSKMHVPGHATLMRAAPDSFTRFGRFHPEPDVLAGISAGLRAKFDPRGILNPGLMETTR